MYFINLLKKTKEYYQTGKEVCSYTVLHCYNQFNSVIAYCKGKRTEMDLVPFFDKIDYFVPC